MSDIDKTNFRECAQRAIDQHHKNGEIIASLVWSHVISLYESELAIRPTPPTGSTSGGKEE